MTTIQNISSGKMSVGHSPQTKAKISNQSLSPSSKSLTRRLLSLDLRNGKTQEKSWELTTLSHGECWMLNIGEFPREENVSFLSQILQVGVHQKYYLSPRACQGILTRAFKRGKTLPTVLEQALTLQANSV